MTTMQLLRLVHGRTVLEESRIVKCSPGILSEVSTGSREPNDGLRQRIETLYGLQFWDLRREIGPAQVRVLA